MEEERRKDATAVAGSREEEAKASGRRASAEKEGDAIERREGPRTDMRRDRKGSDVEDGG